MLRILSVNVDCFLIELDSLESTISLYRAMRMQLPTGITDLIPAAKTIFVTFDETQTNFQTLTKAISQFEIAQTQYDALKEVVIPVRYNGMDLDAVAELFGITPTEVIKKHCDSRWEVAFTGFAPGFAYLSSRENPFSNTPRLTTPRKRIPAGSVALASDFSGIYPKDSPGGWQLIGSTDLKVWDLSREEPALLIPGTSVIFNDVTHSPVSVNVPDEIRPQSNENSHHQCALNIINTGLQLLVQDNGRPNQTNIGVGSAGAMDKTAFHSANTIVGNDKNAAVLEILNGGFKAKVCSPITLAVTGAQSRVNIKYQHGITCDMAMYQPIALDEGDEIYVAPPTAGLRNYLAIAGGIVDKPILGSLSYDSLAQLGTKPIQHGDNIYINQTPLNLVELNIQPAYPALPTIGDIVEIDIVLGPRTDWFTTESIQQFFAQHWLVTNESDRVGLRLASEQPLVRQITHELPSEGTCAGALQIPPSGQPVLLMNDRPITGGYPIIGAVAKHHLDLIAQIAPGCKICFKPFSPFVDIEL